MVLQRPIFPFVVAFCWIFSAYTNLQADCFRQNTMVPSPAGRTTSSIFTHLADGSKPSLQFVNFEKAAPLVKTGIQHQQQRQAFIDAVARFAIKALRYRFLSALVAFQTTLFDTRRIQDAIRLFAVSFLPKVAALVFLVLQDASHASRIVSTDCVFKILLFQPNEQSESHFEWGINPTTDCARSSQPGQEDQSGYSAITSRVPTTTSTALQMTASADASVIQQREVPVKMVNKDNETEALLPIVASPFSWENQWFPVMPVSYLKGLDPNKPVPVTILGCNLVVWKSSANKAADEWSVFEDTCPHRRSPLSTGQVVAGCLTCRYHGWQFGSDGRVSKFPMKVLSGQNAESASRIRANSFPSQTAGGLLWVFLGKTGDDKIPELPPEVIASENETAGAEWIFNRNPISYISMVENSFDPAHSPWTHEEMFGFRGVIVSPTNAIPMERYEIRTSPTIQGFSLEHTPYQNTTAQVAGAESLTVREFYPPSTVSVASPPFFQTKMWFVPARKYETNVLSFFRTPETRLVKWTRRFPKLQEFIRDTQHTLQYVGDWNYRFLSQDRITMQGQDVRKAGKSLKDLTPDPSDRGVATFQYWLQRIAGGGPFAAAASVADISEAHNSPSLFSRELSFWENHGKYCPRCQNTMRRISITKKLAAKWSNRLMAASLVSALFAGASSVMAYRSSAAKLASLIAINQLVYSVGLRRLFDWSCQKGNRMHKVGPDLWPPHESVFRYQSDQKRQHRIF